jgi:hypothetical protein
MALEIDHEWPEKLLRGWAKSYRETPEYRFPSDPSAEFFPVDMEAAADEIERLRAALESLTEDPPATLDGPDADWEVIIKMRNIAREALGLPHGPTHSNGHQGGEA